MQGQRLTPVRLGNPTPYLVDDPLHMNYLLQQLQQRNELVCLYPIGREEPFALSTLLAVDAAQLVFDAASEPKTNQMLATQGACCVSQLRGVKLQFELAPLTPASHAGRACLIGPAPAAILQLQRRQAFRMRLPISNPIHCVCSDPSHPGLTGTISDLSMGGLGLVLSQQQDLYPDELLHQCCFELPGQGQIETDLRIRDRLVMTLRNGVPRLRYGCRFVQLPPSAQQKIQRYLTQLERHQIEWHRSA
ncbi:flagellar brake protein [Chitiniphilus purpureus]|uniref:Flagellar brake protein YcgR n=1 Tax=Chitiniphilus purpureus TaxID=2981137 RepID=A0ABY6DQV8_9NEIS|nr:flagellar brake protein [Chitiniphilus sp. CD1]UXY16103.1 flagellar brake protein [Chitiniphilus sp. CD1]